MPDKGTNNRPTPSGFLMKGPMWSLGAESGLKSGTSWPSHFFWASFHQTWRRSGSHGLPLRSQEARLYSMRRFMGQAQPQFGYTPRPEGSSVPRRWLSEPASVQDPHQIQLPHDVEPSSRNQENPGNCWQAFMVV